MFKLKCILTFLFLCLFLTSDAQDELAAVWADSVLSTLSIDERIGQLFMERAFSRNKEKDSREILEKMDKYKIGGVCFFQGNPLLQNELTAMYQTETKVPLLVAMDAEWGLGMRFKKEVHNFPYQMTAGAVQDNDMIRELGFRIGNQCKAIGVNVNFAPVADINNNPANPVIHYRSFGEDRFQVAMKVHQFAKGLEEANVMPCIKHFPGHGDTDIDSHYDLPIIPHSRKRLDSLELFPFRVMAHQQVASMMIAHLNIPALDSTHNVPSSLSTSIVTDLLRKDFGYDGLVFTDALEMKAVSDRYGNGELAVRCFEAGNDIILLSNDIAEAFEAIKKALNNGRIHISELNDRVFRILCKKYKYALASDYNSERSVQEKISNSSDVIFTAKMYRKAITLLDEKTVDIPLSDPFVNRTAVISIGTSRRTEFQRIIGNYIDAENHQIEDTAGKEDFETLWAKIKDNDLLIIGLHNLSYRPSKNFGITPEISNLLESLEAKGSRVIICLFGTPYALNYLPKMQNVLVSYEDNPISQSETAQALFGANRISGVLPITATSDYKVGMGIQAGSIGRLGFDSPESVGMSSDSLKKIDELVCEIIESKAAPGCQVLIAKNGKVVYDKSFGHHTYEKKKKVTRNTLYDLASLTKIAATSLAFMKLHDDEVISIFDPIDYHLNSVSGTNKANMSIAAILAHHARLKPWIPFYKKTLSDDQMPKLSKRWYQGEKKDEFIIPVAPSMFMKSEYIDSMYLQILDSELRSTEGYRYSDLGMYLLKLVLEKVTQESFDDFLNDRFYKPLGLRRTMFNPYQFTNVESCAPSEKDRYFRHQTIQGYVHDMGAAMLGGVSAHAGLFSTSNDLAIIGQMLLNGAYYGGKQYFNFDVLRLFTQRYQNSSRRGLGFDMKELDEKRTPNMSEKASSSCYGHLGFTGCGMWMDPEHDLIFIFLSNRTYPNMNNNKLGREDYRPRLQTIVYNAINGQR